MKDLIKKFKRQEVIYFILIVILVMLQINLDLKLPDYMSKITKIVQSGNNNLGEIYNILKYMILFSFLSLISAVAANYLSSKNATSYATRLRKDLFVKVNNFSKEEINNFSNASLITRSTNDVNQVEVFFIRGIQLLVRAPLMGMFAIVKIYNKRLYWSLATLGAIIFLLMFVFFVLTKLMPRFKLMQKLTDKVNNITRENIVGLRVIKAYGAEDLRMNSFKEVNEEFSNNQYYTTRTMSSIRPFMSFIMNTLTLSIYFIGLYYITHLDASHSLDVFSDMIVFSSYAMQVVMSFMMLSMIFVMLPRVIVSSERIFEVLNTEEKLKEGNKEEGFDFDTIVEFDNVSFKYDNAKNYVLKDINFKIDKGMTVGIVGSNASGKSTLIHLITRFMDTTYGNVLVKNVNVKDYKEETLNNYISYVPQKPILFKDTIENNIMFGSNVKDNKKVEESLKLSLASEVVSNKEEKEKSTIAQGATNLSGGEAGRVSIARAIYKNSDIFIFDDSFSALDNNTDLAIRNNLNTKLKDKTKIIVSQRIGTIMDSDLILVLDKGKLVGKGKHKDLIKDCKVYKEIAESQFNIEEIL